MNRNYTNVITVLGTGDTTKTDEFSENLQRDGGRGGYFQSKNLCCRFWTFTQGFLSKKLVKICNMIFRKWGGGSKDVWNFSKKSSVLVASPLPLWKVLMDEYFHYHGSLTTGTCDEAVNWMVFKVIVTIGKFLSDFPRIWELAPQFCCFFAYKISPETLKRCQNFVHASWLTWRLMLEVSFVY